jgi:hypothetical protein
MKSQLYYPVKEKMWLKKCCALFFLGLAMLQLYKSTFINNHHGLLKREIIQNKIKIDGQKSQLKKNESTELIKEPSYNGFEFTFVIYNRAKG